MVLLPSGMDTKITHRNLDRTFGEGVQSVRDSARLDALETALCELALRLGAVNAARTLDLLTDHFALLRAFDQNPDAPDAQGAVASKCPSLFGPDDSRD